LFLYNNVVMARSSEILKYVGGILLAGSAVGGAVTGLHVVNGLQAGANRMGDALGLTTTPEEQEAMEIRIARDFKAAEDSALPSVVLFVAGGAAALGHVVSKPRKPSAYSTGGK
jgi:hypothetical protein